ncbi:MAG: 3-carboxy-cis,cis-muconate cycloisomerase [Bryobacteraceae bacterium]
MFTRMMDSLAATERLSRVFADESVLQSMLDFEAALARVEARAGLIPESAAEAISSAATADGFDVAELTRLALRAGTPAIPLVRMLTQRVRARDAYSAGFVHWGATSQDVVDTALVLLLRQCRPVLEADHRRVVQALRRLSEEHADTVMLGRTLLQPAPPVTFGLKAAGWLGAVKRGWVRVASRFDQALYLQFGGASGTLAALGDSGVAVSEALGAELGLPCPDAPWHGHRDRLAALLAALSIYIGSLGKMALDLALLQQFEIGEVAEPGGEGRGGSSTMPHKRNPTGCMLAVAAAKRAPGQLANFVAGILQEHERGAGGWQAEWASVEGIIQAAGVSLESMAEVLEGLRVNSVRMRQNIEATRGAVFAEKAMMMLAPEIGREAAHQAVGEALPDLPGLRVPEDYLGSAEEFRRRLLGSED